jgi:4-hydroxyproline epimerase
MVSADYDGKHQVTIANVASYRHRKNVAVPVDGLGVVTGDIAWGGNWFFLVNEPVASLILADVEVLTERTWKIRRALEAHGITGADGGLIDHIELYGPASTADAHSRNFVLCPGGAYDRSPCGTGTSAKIACLIADGKIKPGEVWRQESILGTCFDAWGQIVANASGSDDPHITPFIRGSAYVTAEATLILDDADPFQWGIRG